MADLNNIINASKIPDPIKFLQNFDGDAKVLHHWLTAAENVIALYENVRQAHANVYNVWLGVIRSKIIGKANEALVLRNVALNWADIRATLIDYFGDRRDLSTLCQKIPYLKQKNKSVEDFYREIAELSANINQKIVLDQRYAGHVNAVMIFVSEITKNAFIDGLNEPYNLTVRGFRPNSLEEAKSAAEEQFQAMERNRKFNSSSRAGSSQQIPQKNKFPNRSNNQQQNSNAVQQPSHANFAPRFNNNRAEPRNFARPNQEPRSPFPIVEPSARSRQPASQPMSGISYQSRNYQVANVEQNSDEQSDHQEHPENDDEAACDFYENDLPSEETNFHLASGPVTTG